jgi:hypothetical protein
VLHPSVVRGEAHIQARPSHFSSSSKIVRARLASAFRASFSSLAKTADGRIANLYDSTSLDFPPVLATAQIANHR